MEPKLRAVSGTCRAGCRYTRCEPISITDSLKRTPLSESSELKFGSIAVKSWTRVRPWRAVPVPIRLMRPVQVSANGDRVLDANVKRGAAAKNKAIADFGLRISDLTKIEDQRSKTKNGLVRR